MHPSARSNSQPRRPQQAQLTADMARSTRIRSFEDAADSGQLALADAAAISGCLGIPDVDWPAAGFWTAGVPPLIIFFRSIALDHRWRSRRRGRSWTPQRLGRGLTRRGADRAAPARGRWTWVESPRQLTGRTGRRLPRRRTSHRGMPQRRLAGHRTAHLATALASELVVGFAVALRVCRPGVVGVGGIAGFAVARGGPG